MSIFTTRRLAFSSALAGVLVLGACGDDDDATEATASADADLVVEALDIRFDKDAYDAAAGDVKIDYLGKGQQVHTLLIEDASGEPVGDKLEVRSGTVDSGTYPLEAGTYDLYCDVPGHREAGMEATLTVS